MADLKKQTEKLIAELPVSEEVKQTLLKKLESEGVSEDLIVELRVAVAEAQVKLNQDFKPQLDQLKKLEEDEAKELAAAYKEFDSEMNQIEKDADQIEEAVSQAVEQQGLEDTRKKIASQ